MIKTHTLSFLTHQKLVQGQVLHWHLHFLLATKKEGHHTPHKRKKNNPTKMTKQKQHVLSFSLLLLFLLHCTTTLAQGPAAAPAAPVAVPAPPAVVPAPPAAAPAPSGPTNVTKILEKAGQFTVLIRLMKATSVDLQLYNELNNSNNGITIFAPSDSAFSSLKAGTLNSLTDQQKDQLIQYHVIPQYISMNNFQTLSNPVTTNAGDPADGYFPLNVTNNGNSINITTGLTNTSVSGTIYTDNQLAIYQVDKVLQPEGVFDPRPPPPAPAPAPPKKKRAAAPTSVSLNASSAVSLAITNVVSIGVAIVAALCL